MRDEGQGDDAGGHRLAAQQREHLGAVGGQVAAGEACAVVESVKAASDVFAPLAGRVTEVNAALADDPGLVNREAQSGAWFFRLAPADAAAFAALLDAAAYAKLVETA